MKRSLSCLFVSIAVAGAFLVPVGSATAASHPPATTGAARKAPKDTTPTGPVTSLRVTATALKTISLAWTDPTDADLAHVMIRRAVGSQAPTSNSDGTLVAVLGRNRTTFTDKRLAPATTYSYSVFTLDRHRNQSAAADVSGTTLTTNAKTGLKGRLTDRAGHPLGNVIVDLAVDGSYGGSARTDSTGKFTATNLVPGSWTVCFEPQQQSTGPSATGYLPGCYRQQPFAYSGSGTAVTVVAGKISTGINDYLAPSGAISGRLIDSAGHSADGVYVQVTTTQAPDYLFYSTTTAADGTYTLKDLPTGSYPVCFESALPNTTAPTGYVNQCWHNEPNGFPDSIPVTAGQNHTGIDATMQVAGELKGHIVDDQGNLAVGVTPELSPRVDSSGQGTDYQGNYADVGIAPGHYQACFDGSFGSSPTAPYGYGSDCANPQNPDFDLSAGQVVVQNATVTRAGAIGGQVTGGGQPLDGVEVWVLDGNGNEVMGTSTGFDGNWQLAGFSPGDYTVCYDPTYTTGGYRRGCYDSDLGISGSGTPITVAVAQLTSVDAALVEGASIEGTITDANGGPIDKVAITAYPLAGSGQSYYGYTDETGHYTLGGAEAGQYAICFDTSRATGVLASGYLSDCYNNKPMMEEADPVTVGDSGSVTVDAVLDPGAAITGHVTDSDGRPLLNAEVSVQTDSNLVYAQTDENGDYVAPGIAAGTAYVCFDGRYAFGTSSTGYVPQCWNGKPGGSASDPITVSAGQTTAGIDAELALGAEMTGTVTDTNETGIAYASIDIEGADGSYVGGYGYTDQDGNYTVSGLPAEPVTVCFYSFEGGPDGTGYVSQCWNDAPDASTATPVVLTAGQITSGINATMVETPAA